MGWEAGLDHFRLRGEVAPRQSDHRVIRGKRLIGGDVIMVVDEFPNAELHADADKTLRRRRCNQLLDRAQIPSKELRFDGGSMLSEVLQMTLFTDYVSFYVAVLNGADPSPNTSIDYLKDRLAKA